MKIISKYVCRESLKSDFGVEEETNSTADLESNFGADLESNCGNDLESNFGVSGSGSSSGVDMESTRHQIHVISILRG